MGVLLQEGCKGARSSFCGGVKNVLAVCNQDTQISKAAQQRDSLLLRFKTEEEVGSLRHHLSTSPAHYGLHHVMLLYKSLAV